MNQIWKTEPGALRADTGLASFLTYENVAWFDGEVVRILDRRVYPMQETYVVCRTVEDVASAIKAMVTQSGGPKIAAFQSLRLAARLAKTEGRTDGLDFIKDAARLVANARPTTAPQMERMLFDVIRRIEELAVGHDLTEATDLAVMSAIDKRYASFRRIAGRIADRVPENGRVLTYCFAELLIGYLMLVLTERGKKPTLICPETRPYLQGSRLTASVGVQSGVPVELITDGMTGALMAGGEVDVFVTAADVIAMDGHVVNKVGTYTTAVLAQRHGVPYFVGGLPSKSHPTISEARIEERDPREVTEFLGQRIAMEGVKGRYPAFDITPPELVTAVATPDYICAPSELRERMTA